MKVSKLVVSLFAASFSLPLIAQNEPATPAACGDLQVSMEVKLDKKHPPPAQPEPGKALVYFIQDAGQFPKPAYPTTEIGMDGKWIGANKKDSYFSVAVEPGEHHLCAAIQSSFVASSPELAHLTAEAGNVYYFRTRIFLAQGLAEYFSFLPVDSDEARYLIASYPLATAHPRK